MRTDVLRVQKVVQAVSVKAGGWHTVVTGVSALRLAASRYDLTTSGAEVFSFSEHSLPTQMNTCTQVNMVHNPSRTECAKACVHTRSEMLACVLVTTANWEFWTSGLGHHSES